MKCEQCPSCGEHEAFHPTETVDNGVCEEPFQPAYCENCGWSAQAFYELFLACLKNRVSMFEKDDFIYVKDSNKVWHYLPYKESWDSLPWMKKINYKKKVDKNRDRARYPQVRSIFTKQSKTCPSS